MKEKTIFKIFLIVFLFGFLIYFPFLGEKEFQGEEGRRVLIALQMLETKEFLIPKPFDEPYFNKPPLFNWALAAFFAITRNYSEFTARALSSLSLIVSAFFLCFIWQKILTKLNLISSLTEILLPGLIFLTIPEVIDKATRAEIDAFYTMLITLGVFSWFYLYEVKDNKKIGFLVAGFFLGLGVLTKTFQALIFFYLALVPYLSFQKRLRELFSFSHLLGIWAILMTFLLWAIPVSQKIGLSPFLKAWFYQYLSSAKAQEMSFLQHLESFTLSALIGYSPWIWFGLTYKSKNFRSFIKENPLLFKLGLYSLCLFIFSYLFHFLFPGARLRYTLPAVSGLAFLSGIFLLFYFKNNNLSEKIIFFTFKLLPLLNCILAFGLLLYFKIFLSYELSLYFYFLYSLFLIWNLLAWFRGKTSPLFLFYFLLILVFLIKHLYSSFYFPLHQKEMNYYRKSALEVGNLIKEKKELYLCQNLPHHFIYYLKYRYQLVERINYLKNCEKLPANTFVLFFEKEFSEEYFSKYTVYNLRIRNKNYFLVKT